MSHKPLVFLAAFFMGCQMKKRELKLKERKDLDKRLLQVCINSTKVLARLKNLEAKNDREY